MQIRILHNNQFESKEYIINNIVIKNQWLTNIIFIGDNYYKFVNFETYSNGEWLFKQFSFNQKEFFFEYNKMEGLILLKKR